MDASSLFDQSEDGPVLRLHVQPGGGRSQVTGTFSNALKVRVAAPPEGGRANEAVLKFLADALGAGVRDLELKSGERSRSKRVLLRGVEPETLTRALESLLEGTARPGAGARKRP